MKKFVLFSFVPVAIRIENRGDSCTLYWKVTDGRGGYVPGELILSEQKTLDAKTWLEFKVQLDKAGFWDLPTEEAKEKTVERDGKTYTVREAHFDGAQWILEGAADGRYHFVDRWTPGGEIRGCCDFLLDQTGLDIPPKEKY